MPSQRIITALALVVLFVPALLILDYTGIAILAGVITGVAAWEWSAMSGYSSVYARILYLAAILVCLSLIHYYMDSGVVKFITILAVIWWFAVFGLVIAFQRGINGIFQSQPAKAMMGFLVLVPAWTGFIQLQQNKSMSLSPLIFFLILVWSADTIAYFCGRRWGKTRLCSNVSPGKSREGLYAAILITTIISIAYGMISKLQGIEIFIFLFICILSILGSVLGDLLESMVKRSMNMKDSGQILPGHGGVMDRIDSVTAAAPLFLLGLWIMESQR